MQRANLGTVVAGAAFVVSAAFCCAPLASRVHLVDLHVYRMGGDATLCAVTGLLISPISWTHHWVLAVPALLLAVVATGRNWPRHRLATLPAAVAATAIAVVAWDQVARHVPNAGWLRLPSSAIIRSEIYVIIGLGALVLAAAGELTRTADWLHRRRRPISLAE